MLSRRTPLRRKKRLASKPWKRKSSGLASGVSKETKLAVFLRQEGKCAECGRHGDLDHMDPHHCFARSLYHLYNKNEEWNISLLHRMCHTRIEDDAAKRLEYERAAYHRRPEGAPFHRLFYRYKHEDEGS